MKTVGVKELQQRLPGYVDQAQRETVVITRRGKPAAIVVGVLGKYDWEDIVTMSDPDFWRMIRERRAEQGGESLEAVKRELGIKSRPRHARRKTRR